MSRPRVFVSVPLKFHDPCPVLSALEQAHVEVVHQIAGQSSSDDETRDKLVGMAGIMAGGETINDHTLAKADHLKIVARFGVGYDRVDLAACTAHGIMVTTTPGTLCDAVADETLALMLAVIRRVPEGDRKVKAGEYGLPVTEDLASMTLGLIGCGAIGAEVVRRALGFKMRVLACDPWVDRATIEALGAVPVSLDELVPQADVISLHTPLNAENQGMINADFLARLKPGSFLVNTARGGLVDEEALIAALQSGHLAGAGLDVQATEPPVGRSLDLMRLDRVVAMPHVGSNTVTARERMGLSAAHSIIECLEGRIPETVINPEVLDRLRK